MKKCIVSGLLVCVLLSMTVVCNKKSSKNDNLKNLLLLSSLKPTYLYIPGAKVNEGSISSLSFSCSNPSYPYQCSKAKVCCSYQYYCPDTNLCYSLESQARTACGGSGQETCSGTEIKINSVKTSSSSISAGQTVTYTVNFTTTVTVEVIVIYMVELDIYWEVEVTQEESEAGQIEIELVNSEVQPEPSQCSMESRGGCSQYQLGGCWCAVPAPSSMSNADAQISLLGPSDASSANYNASLAIDNGGFNFGDTGGGQICDISQYEATCPDNTTKCCSVNQVCCTSYMDYTVGCNFEGVCE